MSELIPRLSNKIFVVFPGGVKPTKNGYRVYFGYNDYQCRTVEVTKEKLKELMIPIEYKKEELV